MVHIEGVEQPTPAQEGQGESGQPAEEAKQSDEEESQLSESEEESNPTHTPVVIQSAAKTPRMYNDE